MAATASLLLLPGPCFSSPHHLQTNPTIKFPKTALFRGSSRSRVRASNPKPEQQDSSPSFLSEVRQISIFYAPKHGQYDLNFRFEWILVEFSGGFEVFGEIRRRVCIGCCCDKVRKHNSAGDNKTQHPTGSAYGLGSGGCGCLAFVQAESTRLRVVNCELSKSFFSDN